MASVTHDGEIPVRLSELSEEALRLGDAARRRAVDELARVTAESERLKRFYGSLISSTPDLIYAFDLNYRFTFANKALLEMWGRTLEQSVGKNLIELGLRALACRSARAGDRPSYRDEGADSGGRGI